MRQKMHACNESNQSVSQSLERHRVENPPLFSPLRFAALRFPFPSPKRNIHMSVYVPYFSN